MFKFLVFTLIFVSASMIFCEAGVVPSAGIGYGQEIVPLEGRAEIVRPGLSYGVAAPVYGSPLAAKEAYGLRYAAGPVVQQVVPVVGKEAYGLGYAAPVVQGYGGPLVGKVGYAGYPGVAGYVAPIAAKGAYGLEYAASPALQGYIAPVAAKEAYGYGVGYPAAVGVNGAVAPIVAKEAYGYAPAAVKEQAAVAEAEHEELDHGLGHFGGLGHKFGKW